MTRGVAALALVSTAVLHGAEPTIRYNRDVRPILADNCFACHGPDNSHRKAGLRMDTREGMLEKTAKRDPAIVPGNLEKSEAWARIITKNPDDIMPPPDSHKQLKPEQVEIIRKWILAGAPWEGHWAFNKPERPPVPEVKGVKTSVRNPIDNFIFAKLKEKGLKPNPEADKRTLARRVYLDLTGLPPKPDELNAFLNDKSKDAYEKLVKKLLASPAYGEHRARYWLDAARYADTHGLHFDNYREMWPYRDWVIKAFNSNIPFDRFVLMQLAGDLLSEEDIDAMVATGFQRCAMTTNEGGTIDEENQANLANDHVSTFGWVFLGLTMNCASCHDHKFDPITQKDFYSLAAYFRNSTIGAKDGNVKDSAPSILVPQSEADAKRWKSLPKELADARSALEERRKSAQSDFSKWSGTANATEFSKEVPKDKLLVHLLLNEGKSNTVTGVAGKPGTFTATGDLDWKDGGRYGFAPKLKKNANFNLGDIANFDRTNAFSYGAWVRISQPGPFGPILARMDQDAAFRGWDLAQIGNKIAVHLVNQWPEDGLKVETRSDVLKPGQWQHFFMTYDGSGKAKGVKLFVDGVEVPTRVDKDALKSTIISQTPLRIGQRSKDQVLEDGRVQDVRIYSRRLTTNEVAALAKIAPLQYVLSIPAEQRTKEQQSALFESWLTSRDSVYAERSRALSELSKEQEAIKTRNPVTLVWKEKLDTMPTAHVLFRGEYDKKKDKVIASVPGVLHRMPEGAPTNRLGLAQWLNAADNPLTSRVAVNRMWAEVFGVGIVKTADDFGTTGEAPVNQELLDWLAVEFRESGWNIKHLFELMVTSAAYRQSAETTQEHVEKDPANRLVSRGPRFRMDAETLRDAALASSGLLVSKIGGPSVKPYQPQGVWEAVAMPESNTKRYKADTGENLYRRSLYTFWKRAAPPATMDLFNAPSREVCSVKRERTNTPLQALATLNDPQFVEAARHLAQLALLGTRKEEEAIQQMAERVLSRPLTSKELGVVKSTLKEMQSYYAAQPDAARQLLSVGESKPSDKVPATQLAAMTMVANQLMNLDEALNK